TEPRPCATGLRPALRSVVAHARVLWPTAVRAIAPAPGRCGPGDRGCCVEPPRWDARSTLVGPRAARGWRPHARPGRHARRSAPPTDPALRVHRRSRGPIGPGAPTPRG